MGPNLLQFRKSGIGGNQPVGFTLIEALAATRLMQDTKANRFSAISSKSIENHYHFYFPSEESPSSEYEIENSGYETKSLDEITVKPQDILDDQELLAITARHLRDVNHAVQNLTKHVENILMTIEEREKNEFNR
uniref:Uncharacterized protein n=1 Tax=Candidatus Kentrum sp. FM TaxID=2126340 RepID=A0A450SYN5_9GAMM|nr:MAG: hypothetical protein BECKFM1743A_GA0114220_102344 [Candidatus Kentron sp. FM]VFJ67156.1 MAG: hypothetical protein BECKFM1743C_GA0114222_104463 [Candidatus Kentron sp. FM]VFK17236.1 MAG: hypothetical protein BECKFM1743B_GA0114221_104683 [Candidatus Kentron sp. FM]